MNANYVKICRLGNLEADFQQVPLSVSELFIISLRNVSILNSAKKVTKKKEYFLRQKVKKKLLYYKIDRSDQFLAINLILGYIFENKTKKQKRQMVSDKILSIRTKYFHLK